MDYNKLGSFLYQNCSAAAFLADDLKNNKLAHAYLISSADAFTANMCAAYIAFLATEDAKTELAEAVFCRRHADVQIYPENGETVLTADIDKLIANLYLKPTKGDKKFFIIQNGETMNPSCQNKLLKSLEEPPPSAYIIICASRFGALLPTVESRCKKLFIEPFSQRQILEALSITNPNCADPVLAAALSGGKLGEAIGFCSDKKYIQVFDTAIAALTSLNSSKDILSSSAKLINYKDRLGLILDFYELIFCDILAVYCESRPQLAARYAADLDTLKNMYSLDAALKAQSAVLKAKKRIKGHGNANSIVDEMLFSFAESKARFK